MGQLLDTLGVKRNKIYRAENIDRFFTDKKKGTAWGGFDRAAESGGTPYVQIPNVPDHKPMSSSPSNRRVSFHTLLQMQALCASC